MKLVFLIALLSLLQLAVTACNTTDNRNALNTFYAAASGSTWTNNLNWNTTASVSTWYGVTCVGTNVTAIN